MSDLRRAIESFQPHDHDELGDDGKPTGRRACSSNARTEYDGLVQNAEVGYYAGKTDDLATDLAAVGAPKELVAYAKQHRFDDEQVHLAGVKPDGSDAPMRRVMREESKPLQRAQERAVDEPSNPSVDETGDREHARDVPPSQPPSQQG